MFGCDAAVVVCCYYCVLPIRHAHGGRTASWAQSPRGSQGVPRTRAPTTPWMKTTIRITATAAPRTTWGMLEWTSSAPRSHVGKPCQPAYLWILRLRWIILWFSVASKLVENLSSPPIESLLIIYVHILVHPYNSYKLRCQTLGTMHRSRMASPTRLADCART